MRDIIGKLMICSLCSMILVLSLTHSVNAGEETEYFLNDTFSSSGYDNVDANIWGNAQWINSTDFTSNTYNYNSLPRAQRFNCTDTQKVTYYRDRGDYDTYANDNYNDHFDDQVLFTSTYWDSYTQSNCEEPVGTVMEVPQYAQFRANKTIDYRTHNVYIYANMTLAPVASDSGYNFTIYFEFDNNPALTIWLRFWHSDANKEIRVYDEFTSTTHYQDLAWDGSLDNWALFYAEEGHPPMLQAGYILYVDGVTLDTQQLNAAYTTKKITNIMIKGNNDFYNVAGADDYSVDNFALLGSGSGRDGAYTEDFYAMYRKPIGENRQTLFQGYSTYLAGNSTTTANSGDDLYQVVGLSEEKEGNVTNYIGFEMNFRTKQIIWSYDTYINGSIYSNTSNFYVNNLNWYFLIEENLGQLRMTVTVGNDSIKTVWFTPAYDYSYLLVGVFNPNYCDHGCRIVFDRAQSDFKEYWYHTSTLDTDDLSFNTTAWAMEFQDDPDDIVETYTRISKEFKAITGIIEFNRSKIGSALGKSSVEWRFFLSEFGEHTYYSDASGNKYRHQRGGKTYELVVRYSGLDSATPSVIIIFYVTDYRMGTILSYQGQALTLASGNKRIECSFRAWIDDNYMHGDLLFKATTETVHFYTKTNRTQSSNDFMLTSWWWSPEDDIPVQARIKGLAISEEIDDYIIPELQDPDTFAGYIPPPAPRGFFTELIEAIVGFITAPLRFLGDLFEWAVDLLGDIFDFLAEIAGLIWAWIITNIGNLLTAFGDWLNNFIRVTLGWGDLLDLIIEVFDIIATTIGKFVEGIVFFASIINTVMFILFVWMVLGSAMSNEENPSGWVDSMVSKFKINLLPVSVLGIQVFIPLGGVVFVYIFSVILGVI